MLASVDEGPTDPTSPQGLRKSCRPGPAESPNPRPETPRTQGPPRDEGQNAKQPGTPDQRPRGPTDGVQTAAGARPRINVELVNIKFELACVRIIAGLRRLRPP